MDERLEKKVRDSISRAGYSVGEVERLFPPLDPGGEMEVLFRGELKCDPISLREPLTAYIRDTGTRGPFPEAVIGQGW